MIDSHSHLAGDAFSADLEPVVLRAQAAGVQRTLVILAAGDAAEEAQALRVLALWHASRVAIGVHPHAAHEFGADPQRAADAVRSQFVRSPAARAVGEIGLDYHYDFSPRDVQQEVFRAQLRLARELRQPVVIHTREADDDTIRILREEGQGAIAGVLHCFSGTAVLARAGLDLGLHISLAGILTFPKASDLRETVKQVPVDRLLVETDSPFLAPVPHRGKRNEPAYVVRVLETLAAIHDMTAAAMAERTTETFEALFSP